MKKNSQPIIVVVAYNRIKSLSRILSSLDTAHYPGEAKLLISIDNDGIKSIWVSVSISFLFLADSEDQPAILSCFKLAGRLTQNLWSIQFIFFSCVQRYLPAVRRICGTQSIKSLIPGTSHITSLSLAGRHTSMGGFDIFRSERKEDGSWSDPENLGYPINTPDDEIFYWHIISMVSFIGKFKNLI